MLESAFTLEHQPKVNNASPPSDLQSQAFPDPEGTRLTQWEEFGHQFEPGQLERLKQSIVEMALSRIDGQDELYVGGYVYQFPRLTIRLHC